MQPANTTELQAANTMLSTTIGEAPVDSLTGATSSGAGLADQVLTEVVRETLAQGWYFNIDKNSWLYRDGLKAGESTTWRSPGSFPVPF